MGIDRSKAFCQDWCLCRLIEIADIKGGKRLPAGEQFSEEETPFPYIRVTDMVNGTVDDREMVYVKPAIEPLIRNYKISSQDLYVTMAGTLGQFGRIPDHLNGAQLTENAAKITKIDTSKVDIDFLCHYLRSEQISKQVDIATGTGGGVPKLPLYQIEQFLVQHPSLPEQVKIAEILTTVDRAIEQTEALIAKQQRTKTGLMQDLLTRGIDEHGNLRSEKTHKFKDSPLGRIPVEWKVEKWSQVCSKIQDGAHFSPRTDSTAEFKYVTSKNVRFGNMDLSEVEYIDKRQHDEIYKRCNVCFGDVLLTKDGANTGNAAINFLDEEFSLLSSIALLRPLQSKLTATFLLQTILSENGQRMIKDAMSGLAITRVTLDIINSFLIKVPPIREQKTIGQILTIQDRRIESEVRRLAKLCSLKTALMQDLLTGKRRVTQMLEEAARL